MNTTRTQTKMIQALTAQLAVEDVSFEISAGYKGRVYLSVRYTPKGKTMLDVIAMRFFTVEIGKAGRFALVSDSDINDKKRLKERRTIPRIAWNSFVDDVKRTDKILQDGRTKRDQEAQA